MNETTTDVVPVRDAATVIVLRERAGVPHVLMGQRGAGAVFMPGKVVFPGGAVDVGDAAIPLARPLPDLCAERLREESARDLARGRGDAVQIDERLTQRLVHLRLPLVGRDEDVVAHAAADAI